MTLVNRQVAIAAAVAAVVVAIAIAIMTANAFLPSGTTSTTNTSTTTSSSSTSTGQTTFTVTTTPSGNSSASGVSGPPPGQQAPPVLLGGYLFAQNVSCSLATGGCTLTIVNQSTTPLDLVSCQIIDIDGNVSGPASMTGIQAGSQAVATCTVPTTSQLSLQTAGSMVTGSLTVKLVDSVPSQSLPAGAETELAFQSTWSQQ
jgi:hypothetical protein